MNDMSVELVMPKAGLTMVEGTIASWKVAEGASVKKGEAVMEFENEKNTIECEANADGFIHIVAKVGDVVQVGQVVAQIGSSAEDLGAETPVAVAPIVAVVTAPADAIAVVMPKAGLTMVEGTVASWSVSEGAEVKKGQAVFEFENEKNTIECEADADGFFHAVANLGDVVKVGEVVGYLAPTKEAYDALVAGGSAPVAAISAEPSVAASVAPAAVIHSSDGHVRATGLARNIAKSAGVDLTLVGGTGPNNRIIAGDVYAYIEAAKSAPVASAPVVKEVALGEIIKTPLAGKRKSIAKNMRKAFDTMAPMTVFAEVDVTDLMEMRGKYVENKDILGCKISVNDMLMYAVVKMLNKHPNLNSTFDGEVISTYPYVNLGMAVGVEGDLIVPILKNAEQLSLSGLSKALRDLAIRAKDNGLVNGEQTGGTFTVTNVGMFNIDFGTPVIAPPQVAILGFGTSKKKFVEYKGEFCPRTMMHMMLTVDHRVIDGREAGEVLSDMKLLLENPELMFV